MPGQCWQEGFSREKKMWNPEYLENKKIYSVEIKTLCIIFKGLQIEK